MLQTFAEWFHCETMPSSLDFAVRKPTLRDHRRHTGVLWLRGKRADDGVDAHLWRIHNALYDFTPFVNEHPGGKDWLVLTQGTDITEAFEAHHISTLPESMLARYRVREITTRRNSPFTFAEDGFYRTLKGRVRAALEAGVAPPQPTAARSDLYADGMFVAYLMLAYIAAIGNSWLVAAAAGIALSMLVIIAHNYFHRRDNFRMYYFDLCMMSSKAWRITHALSHHIFPNTVYDYEIAFIEPFFQYMPRAAKSTFVRYASWVYGPFIYFGTFPLEYIRTLFQVMEDGWHTFEKTALLPFTVPLGMLILTDRTLLDVIILFAIIIASGGAHFGLVGLNAAHHHPHIFHDGDAPRKEKDLDWGLHQLDATADRPFINESHFMVLTNFGDHSMHHLFPTLDHGRLAALHPLLLETCAEFDAEICERSQWQLVKGQYAQLARVNTRSYNERHRHRA